MVNVGSDEINLETTPFSCRMAGKVHDECYLGMLL